MAMKNFKCSMKLVHCLCLSRIFTNDRDSISFKIFGHDISFTLEDFHIMCGLRITTHNVEKPSKLESKILKRYFGKSKGVTLKDIRDFMSHNEIQKDDVNFKHVCESDEDANESTVLVEYAAIVEDDKACADYPGGNVPYQKRITSMKHALDNRDKYHSTEYTVGGFPFPLCAWFYDRFPDIRQKYLREDEYLDAPQVPRILRYVCVGEPKYKELHEDYFGNHGKYQTFRVLDIILTEEEFNAFNWTITMQPDSFKAEVFVLVTMEVKRHIEEERRMIEKEVVEQFQRDE
ncbi:uncharacterized protein LOC142165369 [Nicotiana tabacum]|uniref:Uncharacterized protein LOC142165369 n=1 Tax=Nicotiana tabacum TaxID=4097 RepID=A0AC58S520_TOBAC